MKFSICLTVYNQIDLVRKNLQHILMYHNDNVEVIVNDDCSTDDIEQMVKSFRDKRVKYYRNENNLGHDLNILAAFKHCTSNYAFLLRSRDFIIGNNIDKIISVLDDNKNASFFFFSAINQDGDSALSFSNKRYTKGIEAIGAHKKVFIHPSGVVYNLKYFDLFKIEDYIKNNFKGKYGFVVHHMMRAQAAIVGDFISSSAVVWIYSQKTSLVAVNSAPNKISVYAPLYQYQRYRCEFNYINNVAMGSLKKILLLDIVRKYYKAILFDFKYTNKDKKQHQHYNCDEIEYDQEKEKEKFILLTVQLIKNVNFSVSREIERELLLQSILVKIYYPVKMILVNSLQKSKLLPLVSKLLNHL